MKKSTAPKPNKLESSSDENSSPTRKPNMMLNWLKNSAKKGGGGDKDKEDAKKPASEPPKSQENKSQYFGTARANQKDEEKPKVTVKSAKKQEESASSEKKSPKAEFKKKQQPKVIEFEDDDEDDFVVNKKKKNLSPPATKTPPKSESSKGGAKKSAHKTVEPEPKPASTSAKKPANKYYAAYMRREGPKNPGSKPIPIGKKDCFAGLKFLITGVLDSMDRDQCKSIIEKYGGSVVSGVTKKLDYLIIGDDAGQAKLEKAAELNIKKLNEDEFLKLICDKSGISEPKYEQETPMMIDDDDEEPPKVEKQTSPVKTSKSPNKPEKIEQKVVEVKKSPNMVQVAPKQQIKSEPESSQPSAKTSNPDSPSELWVEKYKPKSMNKIIGQMGEKSNANKLLNWLKNWNKWHLGGGGGGGKKAWNDQDTGSSFKCALLSGPPGIGKTTTAQLTCKEAGYTYIEMNASDSRSKKLLDGVLGESADSASIDSYFKGKHKASDLTKDKHCIIMDEVDGMAGNEDRGGIQQLLNIIKSAKIPIICICNDRQHPKIRTLANYCFDLRFYKPRIEQVRSSLMSVCFKEGIKISTELLDQIIIGCNYDIRQCLHNLSMWSSNNKNFVATSQKTASDIEKAMKDIRMNPFEACKQVFQGDVAGKPAKTIIDKMDLFFTDYSLMPLLIQENYLSVHPLNLEGSKQKRDRQHLNALEETVESLIEGDRVGRLIRTNNNWSLLPTQAVFATLIPGEKVTGNIGLPAFPSWFGKNSKQGRVDRILQELQKHMRIHISANKLGVGMDYLSVLKQMLTKPLISKGAEGIPKVIELMNEYSLTREDFDTIVELATWPNQKDVMTLIDSKVKASFTRAYNKESHKNPFAVVSVKKLKAAKISDDPEDPDAVEDEEENQDNDDITSDAMIKANTKKTAARAASSAGAKTSAGKRAAKASDEVGDEKPKATKKKKT